MRRIECPAEIAIVMAVYNGEAYLSRQIDSLLNQSFKDWHLYIHDDGSADRSAEILKEYEGNHPQKITVLSAAPAGGSKKNFLYMMRQIDAPYMMFCDQDDVWLDDKIEKTFAHMREVERNQKPAAVFTDLCVVDQSLHVISDKMSTYQTLKMDHTSFHQIMMQNIVTGCTLMINRKCLELARRCADDEKMIMHDWWIALTASYFGVLSAVDEPLMLYRQHGDNSVGAKNLHSGKYLNKRLKQNEETKHSLLLTQEQAACFLDTFHVTDEGAKEFSRFCDYGKLKKLHTLLKYHLWKNNLIRNLGLIWYC